MQVRHLPEGLCFIFYCMSNCLLLKDTRGVHTWTRVDFQEARIHVYMYLCIRMCVSIHIDFQEARRHVYVSCIRIYVYVCV